MSLNVSSLGGSHPTIGSDLSPLPRAPARPGGLLLRSSRSSRRASTGFCADLIKFLGPTTRISEGTTYGELRLMANIMVPGAEGYSARHGRRQARYRRTLRNHAQEVRRQRRCRDASPFTLPPDQRCNARLRASQMKSLEAPVPCSAQPSGSSLTSSSMRPSEPSHTDKGSGLLPIFPNIRRGGCATVVVRGFSRRTPD
jgi:hypothetical protein